MRARTGIALATAAIEAASPGDVLALVSLGPDGSTVAEHTVADVARESRRAARALQALGIGKVSLRTAVGYANERVVFGRAIGLELLLRGGARRSFTAV